ncbi:MAG: DMT family transporter [Limibacillus sp.]|jgi:drug/metabolite transporter (DMT)-like permease
MTGERQEREPLENVANGETLARVLLFVTPSFFASNMLIARATAELVPPVALAFGRWALALAILLALLGPSVWRARRAIAGEAAELALLGALGMGVCGAFVYIGADSTTATNIGMIYATSPVMIILLARAFYGERLTPGRWLGVFLALAGMMAIVFRGQVETLLTLDLTRGDLWIMASAFSWALYSILLKHRPTRLEPKVRFAAIMLFGTLVLAPFTLLEALLFEAPEINAVSVGAVVFLALVPALGAYGSYGYVQRHLGASKTGLMLYLSPVYTAVLAYFLLAEALQGYHLLGAALVLPGLWLATRRD